MPPRNPVPVHRPSVSEIALALAQKHSAPQSSARIWTNAAGDPQWEVDVKHDDPLKAYAIALSLARKAQRDLKRAPKLTAPKTVVVHSRAKKAA